MADPLAVYVFLIKRPEDAEAWACLCDDPKAAEDAYGRVSEIMRVEFTAQRLQ
jgi:hypothetical protein